MISILIWSCCLQCCIRLSEIYIAARCLSHIDSSAFGEWTCIFTVLCRPRFEYWWNSKRIFRIQMHTRIQIWTINFLHPVTTLHSIHISSIFHESQNSCQWRPACSFAVRHSFTNINLLVNIQFGVFHFFDLLK